MEPSDSRQKLVQLHGEIDQRVDMIRDAHPDWLCAKGCGNCCRRLAEIPQLTAGEWAWLRQGLALLPAGQLQQIRQAVAQLATQATRPITCPMLDQVNDACPVYPHRPVACRTYGFYVQRELGMYCGEIEARVAAGELAEVVWGNHDRIDRSLGELGESRPLTEWFADWQETGSPKE